MTQTVGQHGTPAAQKVATAGPTAGGTPAVIEPAPGAIAPPATPPATTKPSTDEPDTDQPDTDQPDTDGPTAAQGGVAAPAAEPRGGWRAVLRWTQRVLPTLVPAVLMVLIGARELTTAVFSWDEVATADVAQRSYAQIWELSQQIDATITAYYLLMHAWIDVFGNSEAALRAPSLIAMGMAAGLTGELGRRLHSPAAGLTAGLLFCLVPNTSRYAQEARPYALATLVAVASALLLLRALRKPTVAAWAGYAVAVVLLGASHLVAMTSLAAHAVITVMHLTRTRNRSNRIRVLVGYPAATLVAVGAIVPLALLSAGQMTTQIGWIQPITMSALRAGPADIIGSPTGAWVLIGLALLAGTWQWRHTAAGVALAATPVVAVAVASFNGVDVWVARYMLIGIAPVTVLAATAVVSIAGVPSRPDPPGSPEPVPAGGRRRMWFRLGIRLLVVLTVLGWTTWPEQTEMRMPDARNGANYREAAEAIAMDQQPGDVILYQVFQRNMRQGLDYYLRDNPGRPADFLLVRSAAEVGDLRAVEAADPVALLNGRNRIWFFVYGRPWSPLSTRPDLQPVMKKQFRPSAMWRLSSSTLVLYERRALPPAPVKDTNRSTTTG